MTHIKMAGSAIPNAVSLCNLE